MQSVTRWCIDNRLKVFIGWVAIAVIASVLAQAVGRSYSTNFTLPGTESQHALNLLGSEFPAQSGDVDTFVFHTSAGTIDSPAVKTAMVKAITRISGFPHVVGVVSPYGGARRGRDLARPQDRVRDDQLRQAREPAAQQHGRPGPVARQERSTSPGSRSPPAAR